MLMQTKLKFQNCRIWIEADTKKELLRVEARFSRWVFDHIGDPAKFTTVTERKASDKLGDPKRFKRADDTKRGSIPGV